MDRAVLHLSGEVAMIARRREERARELVALLAELADGGRLDAAVVAEGDGPPSGDVDVRGAALLEEAMSFAESRVQRITCSLPPRFTSVSVPSQTIPGRLHLTM